MHPLQYLAIGLVVIITGGVLIEVSAHPGYRRTGARLVRALAYLLGLIVLIYLAPCAPWGTWAAAFARLPHPVPVVLGVILFGAALLGAPVWLVYSTLRWVGNAMTDREAPPPQGTIS